MEKNRVGLTMALVLAFLLFSGCTQPQAVGQTPTITSNTLPPSASVNSTVSSPSNPSAPAQPQPTSLNSYGVQSNNASLSLFDQFPYSWWSHPNFTNRLRARMGSGNASTIMLEFTDYQCPNCAKARNLTQWALATYPNLALEYRHFPLPQMAYSRQAALGAECAADQGKFWEFSNAVMDDNQNLTFDKQYALADRVGVSNLTLWAICTKSQWHSNILNADLNESKKYGVNATPTFVLNRQVFVATGLDEQFRSFVKQALNAS